ncbi:MAG: lysophospholipid acyltransferase family protein [Flavobacteriales bacterium AspAUS03]
MHKIGYFIIRLVSLLPLSVLYAFSNILYVVLKYLIRYRKEVILQNLRSAFPEFSNQKISKIAKKFYWNLSNYMVETIKCISIDYDTLSQYTEYEEINIFETYKKEGKNVMVLIGHLFNWEWFLSLTLQLPQTHSYAVFKPVRNVFFNETILDIRSRFGTINIPLYQAAKEIMRIPNDGDHVFLILGDQSPRIDQIYYSLPFLNQETAAYHGFDKMAKKRNMGVVYGHIIKTGRGRYKTTFIPIKPTEDTFAENEIASQFFTLLEENIRQQPDNWLWSHKRWKHKKGIHF